MRTIIAFARVSSKKKKRVKKCRRFLTTHSIKIHGSAGNIQMKYCPNKTIIYLPHILLFTITTKLPSKLR